MSEIKTAEQRIHKLEGGEGCVFVTFEQALIAERDELRAALAERDAKLAALEHWNKHYTTIECPQCGFAGGREHAAAGAAPVPEGWQLVPVEPTPEMVRAWNIAHGSQEEGRPVWKLSVEKQAYYTYKAVLAAAPKEQP